MRLVLPLPCMPMRLLAHLYLPLPARICSYLPLSAPICPHLPLLGLPVVLHAVCAATAMYAQAIACIAVSALIRFYLRLYALALLALNAACRWCCHCNACPSDCLRSGICPGLPVPALI